MLLGLVAVRVSANASTCGPNKPSPVKNCDKVAAFVWC